MEPTPESIVEDYVHRQAEVGPTEQASFVGLDPIYLALPHTTDRDFVYEQNLNYRTLACVVPLQSYLDPEIDTLWKRPDMSETPTQPSMPHPTVTRWLHRALKRTPQGHVVVKLSPAPNGPRPLAQLYPRDPMMLPPFFDAHNVSEMFDYADRSKRGASASSSSSATSSSPHASQMQDVEESADEPAASDAESMSVHNGRMTIFGFELNGELQMHQLVTIIWSLSTMLLYNHEEAMAIDRKQEALFVFNPYTNQNEPVKHPGMPGGGICCPVGAGKTLIILSLVMCLNTIATTFGYVPPERLAHVRTIPDEVDDRMTLPASDPLHVKPEDRMSTMRYLAHKSLMVMLRTHYILQAMLVYRQSHYRHFFSSCDRLAAIRQAEDEMDAWCNQGGGGGGVGLPTQWKSPLLTEIALDQHPTSSITRLRAECAARKVRVLADIRAELIIYSELFNHIRIMETQLTQLAEETIVRIMPYFYTLKELTPSPIHQSPGLIFCSLALLSNWQREAFRFFGQRLKILIVLANPSQSFTAGINYEGFVRVIRRDTFRADDLVGRHVVLTNVEAWSRFHCNQDNVTKAQRDSQRKRAANDVTGKAEADRLEKRELMRLFRKGKYRSISEVRRMMHGPGAQNDRIFGVCQDLRTHPEWRYGGGGGGGDSVPSNSPGGGGDSVPSSSPGGSGRLSAAAGGECERTQSSQQSSQQSSRQSTHSHFHSQSQSYYDFFNTVFQVMALDESQERTQRTENSSMATFMDISATGRFCVTGTLFTNSFVDVLRQMMVCGFDSHHEEIQKVCRSDFALPAGFHALSHHAKQNRQFIVEQHQDVKAVLEDNVTTFILQMSQEAFRTRVLKVDCIPIRLEVDNCISDDPALLPPPGIAAPSGGAAGGAAGVAAGGAAGGAASVLHLAVPLVFPVIQHSSQQIARVRNCYLRTRRALGFDSNYPDDRINRGIKYCHFTACPLTASSKLPNYYGRSSKEASSECGRGTRKKSRFPTPSPIIEDSNSSGDEDAEDAIRSNQQPSSSSSSAAASAASATTVTRKRGRVFAAAAAAPAAAACGDDATQDDEEEAMLTNFSDLKIRAETRQVFDMSQPLERVRKRDHDCLVYFWSLLRDQPEAAAEGFPGYYFDKYTIEVDYIIARLDADDRLFADAWNAFIKRKIETTEFEGQRDDPHFVLPTIHEIDIDTRLALLSEFYTTPGLMPMAEKFLYFTSSRASLLVFRQRLDAELRRRDMIRIQTLLREIGLLDSLRDRLSAPATDARSVSEYMAAFRELYFYIKSLGGLNQTVVLHPKLDIGITIQKLNSIREIRVCLITYRIGKSGLNAQFANNVLLHDDAPSFLDEMQAGGRAYRQGQTRDVKQVVVTRHCAYELAYRKHNESAYQKSRELLRTTSKAASRDFYSSSGVASSAAVAAASATPRAGASATTGDASSSSSSAQQAFGKLAHPSHHQSHSHMAVSEAAAEGLDTDEDEWNQSNAYAKRVASRITLHSVSMGELRARRWSTLFVSSALPAHSYYFKECYAKSRISVRFPVPSQLAPARVPTAAHSNAHFRPFGVVGSSSAQRLERPMRLYSSFFYFHVSLPCAHRDRLLEIIREYQARLPGIIATAWSTETTQPSHHALSFILKHSFAKTLESIRPDATTMRWIHDYLSFAVVLLDKSAHTPDHQRLVIGTFGTIGGGASGFDSGSGASHVPRASGQAPSGAHGVPDTSSSSSSFTLTIREEPFPESRWLFLCPISDESVCGVQLRQNRALRAILDKMVDVPSHVALEMRGDPSTEIVRFKQMLCAPNDLQDQLEHMIDHTPQLIPLRVGVFVFSRRW